MNFLLTVTNRSFCKVMLWHDPTVLHDYRRATTWRGLNTFIVIMTLEASNPNSHSYVCGNLTLDNNNTGGVEFEKWIKIRFRAEGQKNLICVPLIYL